MKKWAFAAVVIFFNLIFSPQSFAREESWYFNFGLGYGIPKYPSSIQPAIDTLKAAGVSNTPIAVDLGFYWPTGHANILGASINGVSDSYSNLGLTMSVVQTGIFLSDMVFFGNEPGSGLFVRGDAGAARAAVDTNFAGSVGSNYGFGGGGGAGVGIPVSEETRILIQAQYMYRHIQGDNYGTTAITVSGLF